MSQKTSNACMDGAHSECGLYAPDGTACACACHERSAGDRVLMPPARPAYVPPKKPSVQPAGMPLRWVSLDEEHARTLRALMKLRRLLTGEMATDQQMARYLLARWIDEKWREFNTTPSQEPDLPLLLDAEQLQRELDDPDNAKFK